MTSIMRCTLEFASDAGPHEHGIRHLCFFVDDCRAEYRRLLELGVVSLGNHAG